MGIFVYVIFCRIKYIGMEHFKKNQNYIIVANHTSNFDPVITTPFFPNPNKSIAKQEFGRIPIFGYIYKWGSILIDRKNPHSKIQGFKAMKDALAQKLDVVIYPEGKRNKLRSNLLLPFQKGAFKLAIESNTPILPIAVHNAYALFKPHVACALFPRTIYVTILEPLSCSNETEDTLLNKTYLKIKETLETSINV
ncbi:MAG: lysophospholipid acyltransferase family protein [Alphaproteobacteria bacterium]|nr:lysophospholipid acyltransferase family protein [Alphaproteobacteria bacterium]